MNIQIAAAGPQRTVKSKTAFRTISEVAEEIDVPQHVLRFWESKFNQIKPLKRGGGRRYYRPADVDLLRRIRDLLYKDGYTIKGVQKLLKESGRGIEAASEGEPQPMLVLENEVDPDEPGLDGAKRQELEGILAELLELRALLS